MNWWPPNLMSEATKVAYIYFDTKIRPLPKDENGQIDATASGLVDNDVDAFRHAYVSGVFTQEYNEQTANILGWLNEGTSILSPFGSTNMDLWNNSVGRNLAVVKVMPDGNFFTTMYPTATKIRSKHKNLVRLKI